MCEMTKFYVIAGVILALLLYISLKPSREHYRDPIYLNKKKMWCDWYARTNGTIYGPQSNLFSGYAYYDKAY